MKIIAKHSDIYDYAAFDDAPIVNFVRNDELCPVYKFWKKDENGRMHFVLNELQWPHFLNYSLTDLLFGIYPTVYHVVYLITECNGGDTLKTCPLPIEQLLRADIKTDYDLVEFINKFAKSKYADELPDPVANFKFYKKRPFDLAHVMPAAQDAPKAFELLDTPTFAYANNPVVMNSLFRNNKQFIAQYEALQAETSRPKGFMRIGSKTRNVGISVFFRNITFSQLADSPFRYFDIDPLDAYNRIESCLMTLHKEKPCEPSNTTKIVSHGFDLKTSFRNVK